MITTKTLKITIDKSNHPVGRYFTPSNKEEWENRYWQARSHYSRENDDENTTKMSKFVVKFMKEYFPNDRKLPTKVERRLGLIEPTKREKSDFDIKFRECYLESLRRRKRVAQDEQRSFILMKLREEFPDVPDLAEKVDAKLCPEITAYYKRLRRLSEKLFLNRFNYFVTLTYDDKKFESEEEFRKAITMTLAHFANRRGWRYCYCFERGGLNGRLHIHGFFYVPKGEMPGEIAVRKKYRVKDNKLQILNVNTWFEENYGINEFSPLDRDIVRLGDVIKYCSDYCFKSGDNVHYSRHLPCALEETVNNSDIYGKFEENVEKFILDEETVKFLEEDDVVPEYVTLDYIKSTKERLVFFDKYRRI